MDAVIGFMDLTARQAVYDRLHTDYQGFPPSYQVAILLAAIPNFSDDTPLLSTVSYDDDGSGLHWELYAIAGERLVTLNVTGPDPDGQHPRAPRLQASTQDVTIKPLAGQVSWVRVETIDITPAQTNDLAWMSQWTIHFGDGTELTLPAKRESPSRHAEADRFVRALLDASWGGSTTA